MPESRHMMGRDEEFNDSATQAIEYHLKQEKDDFNNAMAGRETGRRDRFVYLQIFSFPGLVSPTTMFKDISSLKPGHYLTLQQGDLKITEYWDLNYPTGIAYDKTDEYYIDELDALLKNSVKDRLNADVQVGYYLSGGLDSSLIAGLIHCIDKKQARHAFSIGFTDHTYT